MLKTIQDSPFISAAIVLAIVVCIGIFVPVNKPIPLSPLEVAEKAEYEAELEKRQKAVGKIRDNINKHKQQYDDLIAKRNDVGLSESELFSLRELYDTLKNLEKSYSEKAKGMGGDL